MSKFRRTTDNILLTFTLQDDESNLFVRAKIFNESLVDITNSVGGTGGFITLPNVSGGLYGVNVGSQFPSEGQYIAKFEVYEDAGFTTPSEKYGTVEEDYRVSNFEQTILDEVPDNILLDNDPRLDNLPDIQNLLTDAQATLNKDEIINTIIEDNDSSEGRSV